MIAIDDTLINGKNVITDKFEISNTFNNHYIDTCKQNRNHTKVFKLQ